MAIREHIRIKEQHLQYFFSKRTGGIKINNIIMNPKGKWYNAENSWIKLIITKLLTFSNLNWIEIEGTTVVDIGLIENADDAIDQQDRIFRAQCFNNAVKLYAKDKDIDLGNIKILAKELYKEFYPYINGQETGENKCETKKE